MTRAAWQDGARVPALNQPPATPHLFETVGAFGNWLPLWSRHLARLRASLAARGWRGDPPADLEWQVAGLLADNGDDVARVATWPGPNGLHWLVSTRRRDAEAEPLPVTLASEPRPPGAAHHKRAPRAWLDQQREAARGQGCHDALIWRGPDLLEATAYNVFVARAGELRTPPAGAALLPGIARAGLLEELRRAGVKVAEARVPLADLASHVVYLTNAVYGPRLARLPGQEVPDPGRAGADLRAAWARLIRS